jgi:hypothetical protein
LEKRIKGITDIKSMLDKTLQSAKKLADVARKTGVPVEDNDWRGELDEANNEDGEYATFINPRKKQPRGSNYMTTNALRDWMI